MLDGDASLTSRECEGHALLARCTVGTFVISGCRGCDVGARDVGRSRSWWNDEADEATQQRLAISSRPRADVLHADLLELLSGRVELHRRADRHRAVCAGAAGLTTYAGAQKSTDFGFFRSDRDIEALRVRGQVVGAAADRLHAHAVEVNGRVSVILHFDAVVRRDRTRVATSSLGHSGELHERDFRFDRRCRYRWLHSRMRKQERGHHQNSCA